MESWMSSPVLSLNANLESSSCLAGSAPKQLDTIKKGIILMPNSIELCKRATDIRECDYVDFQHECRVLYTVTFTYKLCTSFISRIYVVNIFLQ